MNRVLVAGASGYLGRHIVEECSARAHRVRALIRDPDKRDLIKGAEETIAIDLLDRGEQLGHVMEGIDVVVSAAGQPCTLQRTSDRRSFRRVDPQINRSLLHAAIAEEVRKFVYIAVLAGPRLGHLDYVAAHEEFNGFFYSYLDLLEFARRGLAISFGDGNARSNPIHEADLAVACVGAIDGTSPQIEVGGPDIITRREEVEMAFAAVGRKPRVLRIPAAPLKSALPFIRLTDRRRGEMLDFLAAISHTDVLAPPQGSRRLEDYLREHA
jgi:nucleoside-diphosphate-sugar epimerase